MSAIRLAANSQLQTGMWRLVAWEHASVFDYLHRPSGSTGVEHAASTAPDTLSVGGIISHFLTSPDRRDYRPVVIQEPLLVQISYYEKILDRVGFVNRWKDDRIRNHVTFGYEQDRIYCRSTQTRRYTRDLIDLSSVLPNDTALTRVTLAMAGTIQGQFGQSPMMSSHCLSRPSDRHDYARTCRMARTSPATGYYERQSRHLLAR